MGYPDNFKEASGVPKTWIVSVKKGAGFTVMINEIAWLIGGVDSKKDFQIGDRIEKIGAVQLKCDGTFIEKVRKLRSAGTAEPESHDSVVLMRGPRM